MSSSAWLWVLFFIAISCLLFFTVYVVITLSDLESDHLNPQDVCKKLNFLVPGEYIAQGFMTIMFLFTGNWLAFILHLPLTAWHGYKFSKGKHEYDQTEIFKTLDQHKKEGLIKLAFYLIMFFYFMYRMIHALVHRVAISEVAPEIAKAAYGNLGGKFPM